MKKTNKAKELVILFNGILVLILGVKLLQDGMNDSLTGFTRWMDGSGCVLFGLLGIYFNGIFQDAFKRKKVENKVEEAVK